MAENTAEIPEQTGRRPWRALEAVSLAVYLALAAGYACIIPPGSGPDEPDHLAYVRSLAVNHQLPALPNGPLSRDPGRIVTPQAQHPPAYYLLVTPVYWLTGGATVPFYRVARLVSVLLGLGAILLIRRAAQLVFPTRASVLALTVLFASTFGTLQYVSGTLNNESLAALTVSAGLYFAARAMAGARPVLPMALLGVALGLGLLVKLTTSVLVGVMLVVACSLAVRKTGRLAGLAAGARLLGVAVLGTALVSGWWFVRNNRLYGIPTVRAHHRPAAEAWTDLLLYPELCGAVALGNLEELLRSLWAPRWLLRNESEVAYFHAVLLRRLSVPLTGMTFSLDEIVVLAVVLIAVAGLILAWRDRREGSALDAPQRCLIAASLGAIVWLVVGLEYQTLAVDWTSVLFIGRYTPVILPAMGVLLAVAAERLIPQRLVRVSAGIILALLLAYNLTVMFAVHALQA